MLASLFPRACPLVRGWVRTGGVDVAPLGWSHLHPSVHRDCTLTMAVSALEIAPSSPRVHRGGSSGRSDLILGIVLLPPECVHQSMHWQWLSLLWSDIWLGLGQLLTPQACAFHMPEQEGLKQESGVGMEEQGCSWKAIQRPWQFLISCLCSVTDSKKDCVSSLRAVSQIPIAFL